MVVHAYKSITARLREEAMSLRPHQERKQDILNFQNGLEKTWKRRPLVIGSSCSVHIAHQSLSGWNDATC